MGKGNPHRQSGVGRNAGKGWKMEQILESGELALPKVSTRKEKGDKKADIIDLSSKRPVDASSIHFGPNIPKPVEKKSESQPESVKAENKKSYYPKDDLKYWSGDDNEMLGAVVETLEKTREAKLAEVETKIEKEFDPAEKRFIDPMIDDYPSYFYGEKEKADRRKVRIDENWVEAIRQFYIDERKRWGLNRKIAPEKAELLGNYLELKLPVGFPEKKIKSMNNKDKKETEFTPNQSSELLQWIGLTSKRFKEWVKESEKWGSEFGDEETKKKAIFEQIKEKMNSVMSSDSEMKKLFSEEEIPRAVEHVMKYVEKFNFDTKK
ncbi:MAG TPA: hypothetical protein VMQ48_01980 [Candidatus Saccharimonadales bacterium]|nr:hypothetical protein [Candidatus Saccharimonadales bacterium]